MRTFLCLLAIALPLSAQAYMPLPASLLGLALDPELDPLVLDQLMEDEAAPEEDLPEDTTWEEDAAAWEAENDPLVLDEDIFDENGNWIDVMDFFETGEESESVPEPEAADLPAAPEAALASPAVGVNGKPVLYRGGKVFEPGATVHAAAQEEPAETEPVSEPSEEEPAPEPAEETGSVAGETDTVTGTVLEEEVAATATGTTVEEDVAATATGTTVEEEQAAEPEAAAEEQVTEEEEESSWLGGSFMTIALAAGAIGLGVMLLLFKGKMKGPSEKTAASPSAGGGTVPAPPAQEESKLQHAIDEMRGKQ